MGKNTNKRLKPLLINDFLLLHNYHLFKKCSFIYFERERERAHTGRGEAERAGESVRQRKV